MGIAVSPSGGFIFLGLLILLGTVVWLGWWPGLIVIAVILGLSAVLWALIRFGAH